MNNSQGIREHTVPLLLKGKGAITLSGDTTRSPLMFAIRVCI